MRPFPPFTFQMPPVFHTKASLRHCFPLGNASPHQNVIMSVVLYWPTFYVFLLFSILFTIFNFCFFSVMLIFIRVNRWSVLL